MESVEDYSSKAMKVYQKKAIELEPKSGKYQQELIWYYFHGGLNKYKDAVSSNNTKLEKKLKKSLIEIYGEVLSLHNEMNDFDKTLALYQEGLVLDSETKHTQFCEEAAHAVFWQGLIDLGKGDFEKSMGDFNSADQIRKRVPGKASQKNWNQMDFYQYCH